MTLIKWSKGSNGIDRFPFMHSDMGNLFTDLMNGGMMEKEIFKSNPAVNILEGESDFMIELFSPGLEKNDFKIEVEKGILTISADRKTESKEEDRKYTRKEFLYSSFSRSFSLPEQVDADKIMAEYKDGILKMRIPKKEEAKAKAAIEIKVS